MKVERVVVDTNVLISAALAPQSIPARLVSRVVARYRLVFSEATFEELESRLWRPKFDRYITPELRRILLHDLAAIADWVEPDGAPAPLCRDPDDDKFLQLVQQAGCLCLITGDEDMLALSDSFPVPIRSPADALAELTP